MQVISHQQKWKPKERDLQVLRKKLVPIWDTQQNHFMERGKN